MGKSTSITGTPTQTPNINKQARSPEDFSEKIKDMKILMAAISPLTGLKKLQNASLNQLL